MIRIYHNPRCSKSREGLEILKDSNEEFEIREYLKEELSIEELSSLVKKLNIAPIQLVRTNEKIWKDEFKGRDLSDEELIAVMQKNPKLIERPIVEKKNRALIGRPPSEIKKIL